MCIRDRDNKRADRRGARDSGKAAGNSYGQYSKNAGEGRLMKTTLKYYRPYILPIVLIIAFLFGQAMCELALPGYMSDIINNGIVKQDMGYIRHTGLIMIAVAAATVVLSLIHI